MTGTRRTTVVATTLLAAVLAEALVAVAAGALSGLSPARLAALLVPSNVVLGLSLGLAGWPIAVHRPANRVGWLLLGGGITYASTGAGLPLLACVANAGGAQHAGWRLVATVVSGGWVWAVAFFLPLALLCFPDGRLPGRRWRGLVVLIALAAPLAFAAGVMSGLSGEAGVPGYLVAVPAGEPVAAIGFGALPVVYLGALAALIVRFRRGDEGTRRQLLWVLLALLVVAVVFALDPLLPDSLLSILPIGLIPLAVVVAILRHGLLDIRLVFSRSLLYVLLTGAAVGTYVAIVAGLGQVLTTSAVAPSVAATVLVAVAFHPARVWLQRRIDRIVYGTRGDPVRAVAEVGAHLGGDGLDDVLAALCRTLRLPSVSIVSGGAVVARHGEQPETTAVVPLSPHPGRLVVGLRAGERRLAAADERVLTLLAAPIGVALRATELAGEVARSREQAISGREEERRRLRRDLHDGLGPVLTGVVLNAEAARRLIRTDPARSEALLGDLRDRTTAALADIRRLVYELRPPALDSLGLVGALDEYAMVLSRRADGSPLRVTVEAPVPLGDLPAAAEVAAYRIVTEALTNVTRHSSAGSAVVTLTRDGGDLRVAVHDDGVNAGHGWQPGVGLISVRERAAELGGRCTIELDRTGGRIDVWLPVAVAAPVPAARP